MSKATVATKKTPKNTTKKVVEKKKSPLEFIFRAYAKAIASFPLVVIIVSLLLFYAGTELSKNIETGSMDYEDILPQDVPVIAANSKFSDAFGDAESANVVFEIRPNEINSDEPRDIREYEVLEYIEQFSQMLTKSSEEIESITSPVDTLRLMNDGSIPKTTKRVENLIEVNPMISQYIADDGTVAILSIRLLPKASKEQLVEDINAVKTSLRAPRGIEVNGGGSSLEDVYVQAQIGGDMNRTSAFSMIGIVVILLLVFGSVKYAFLPLTTIVVGLVWTFGFVGLVQIPMTSITSSVMSMIMGIGIDFGIQIINRFRQELQNFSTVKRAMEEAISQVLKPLITTTIAACIGFYSMSLGQLSMMSDMGNMMMIGVVFCFLAAVTFVPALTIFVERFKNRFLSVIGGKK